MDVAFATSKRSTCHKRKVGAVIVQDKRIIATGYNGAPKGLPHCPGGGSDGLGDPSCLEHGRCVRSIHAEINAVIACAAAGVRVTDAKLYTTTLPCPPCMRAIINAGISKVVYSQTHSRSVMSFDLAQQAGIEMEHFGDENEYPSS